MTTPKKLSEIGNTRSRHPVDGGMVPYDPKLKNHIVILTEAERRELVREAIVRWTENLYGDRNITIPSIDDWLKEQGI